MLPTGSGHQTSWLVFQKVLNGLERLLVFQLELFFCSLEPLAVYVAINAVHRVHQFIVVVELPQFR
jgi:hypothetical protein